MNHENYTRLTSVFRPKKSAVTVLTYCTDIDDGHLRHLMDAEEPTLAAHEDDPSEPVVTYLKLHGFATNKKVVGEFVRYEKKVSSKAVKDRVDRKVARIRETEDRFVGKEEVAGIRERIIIELLAKAPYVPYKVPFIADLSSKRVFVFTHSATALSSFADMFENEVLRNPGSSEMVVDDYYVASESEAVSMFDGSDLMGGFLTWLWYVGETNSQLEYPCGGVSYSFSPLEKIKVSGCAGTACSVRGDVREARNGVFNGKVVDSIELVLYVGGFDEVEGGSRVFFTVKDFCKVASVNASYLHGSLDDEGDLLGRNVDETVEGIEHAYAFLKLMFERYCSLREDEEGFESLRRMIWEWSRGDVCIKTFADV